MLTHHPRSISLYDPLSRASLLGIPVVHAETLNLVTDKKKNCMNIWKVFGENTFLRIMCSII